MRVTRRWVIGASVLAAAVLAAPVLGRSLDLGSYAGADAAAVTTNITVNPAMVGSPLPAGFVGLSLPPNELAANDFAGTSLGSYLKLLGPSGVIRIGGNSGETTFWTSTGQAAPSWATGVITPDSLRTLLPVLRASGWGVILAVNLKHFDPARAADEARFAQRILGSSLLGIEIGNEPARFYSSAAAYLRHFHAYATAIKQAAPGVSLLGPNSDPGHPGFLTAFTVAQPDVAVVTSHLYPTSACKGSVDTISSLLGSASRQYETASAQALVSAASQLHVPAVVDETNSAVCGGAAGVSNVFASSLWALDEGLRLAQAGVAGAYFEGGIAGCVTYSPLCRSGSGSLTAQPLYYGLLAISAVGTGNFVSVTNPDSANIEAYAVRNGKDLTVVLDDLQNPLATGPSAVHLNLGAPLQLGQTTVLATSSSAGLAAKTGITLGGQQVGADGSFQSPALTPAAATGRTAVVSVEPGSAAIIRFTGNAALPAPTAQPTPTIRPVHTPQPAPSPTGSPSSSTAPVTPRTTPSAPITTAAPSTLTYNGTQVINQKGIDITDTNTLPTGLFFSTFYGGHDSSWAPTTDQTISFKNFSVSG